MAVPDWYEHTEVFCSVKVRNVDKLNFLRLMSIAVVGLHKVGTFLYSAVAAVLSLTRSRSDDISENCQRFIAHKYLDNCNFIAGLALLRLFVILSEYVIHFVTQSALRNLLN